MGAGNGQGHDPWQGSRRVVPVRPHVWRWLAPSLNGDRILEIGPGLRPTAPVPGSHFVDASPHALRQLRSRGGNVSGARGNLAFPDAFFGVVLAFEVLEHVREDEALLAEIARVLIPGGRFLMSVPVHPSKWSPLDEACGHVRRYEPAELFGKVRAAGFEIQGYDWEPSEPPALTRLRAKLLAANRSAVTRLVQGVAFPMQAAFHRYFGKVRWHDPEMPVPQQAGDVRLLARRPQS